MNPSINGFYAAYLTGNASQGLAMLVLRNGTIVGVDAAGAKFDGTYADAGSGFAIKLNVSLPPNVQLIQGATTGPQGDTSELEILLPADFLSQPFIRIIAKHGPLNVRFTKLRELND